MQNTEIWHDVPCAYNNISYYMCETNAAISGHTGMIRYQYIYRSSIVTVLLGSAQVIQV